VILDIENGLPLWFLSIHDVKQRHNERPSLMRLRKAQISCRVNNSLSLRFHARGLTSFAGLELIRQYFRSLDLSERIRGHLRSDPLENDFGVVSMVLLILGLLIAGGRRVRHLAFLKDDPMVLRLAGLKRLPSPRSVGRWLHQFTQAHVQKRLRINEELAAAVIRRVGLRRLTLDVDGSIVSTGLKVDWAFRGFNPHRRKVHSYYPVTAYEAQTGQILRVKNRPGNVHDGKAALPFLCELHDQIRRSLGKGYRLEYRMDGAFFLDEVFQYLDRQHAEYAIRAPFAPWTGLKQVVQSRRRWKRVDSRVSAFSKVLVFEPWKRKIRVVIYRKRVFHRTPKNFQLDLFDPADGSYEYSAIATNKTLGEKNLWSYLNGRGCHEKAYGELRSGFAFDCVPTQHYGANSAWQALSVMAFNLIRGLQIHLAGQARPATRNRRSRFVFKTIQTLRYQWINRAGMLVFPDGYPTLDVGRNPEVKNRFLEIGKRLRLIPDFLSH
jgi:hypothetical protein